MSRCSKCDRKTTEPFATRKPCTCGSVCWYEGPRPEWPPIGAAAFLYGLSIPQMEWTSSRYERHMRVDKSQKLCLADARKIRRLLAGGQRRADIAARFGISASQIARIHKGRTWKEQR